MTFSLSQFLGFGEPNTITVNIALPDNQYCQMTYVANNKRQEQAAKLMIERGYNAVKYGDTISISANLRALEKAFSLKRHSPLDENGKRIPAFQNFHNIFGKSVSCEYWHNGSKLAVNGVHSFTENMTTSHVLLHDVWDQFKAVDFKENYQRNKLSACAIS